MAFVIYNIETTKIHPASKNSNYAETERAAKSKITRIINETPELAGKLAIEDVVKFHKYIEKHVYRTNFMSGKLYLEAYNTPSYCSPSSESYWSM